MYESHAHSLNDYVTTLNTSSASTYAAVVTGSYNYVFGGGYGSIGNATSASGGNENRPVNFSIMFIIKY